MNKRAKSKPGVISDATLEALYSKAVKARDNHTCRFFGMTGRDCFGILEASHIYSRRHKSICFDLDNSLTACSGCHAYLHAHPIRAKELETAILGVPAMEELWRKRNSGILPTGDDKRDMVANFKQIIKDNE